MREKKIFGVVIAMFLVIGFASESLARWHEDQQFNFRINVPDHWQSNSFTDGTDRIYAFVSPDQNVAVRIRAFKVNSNVNINQVISLFESHIFGGGERLSLQDYTLNGIYGKCGFYKGIYNGIQVGASVFYTIQGGNAYIVWGIIPTSFFEAWSAKADAITNTFTITSGQMAYGSGGSDVCSAILGQWKWFNGGVADFQTDGTIGGKPQNTWKCTDPANRTFTVIWNNGQWVDTLKLSQNGTRLDGQNQYGNTVYATRITVDRPAWAGTWETRWQGGATKMHLVQNGNQVTGTYDYQNGRISGTVSDNRLTGHWHQNNGNGTLVFTMSGDGNSFSGVYDGGKWWNGKKSIGR